MVQQFEEAIAKYVGAKYAVSLSNGTAVHAACYAAGITEGDEVITTPMTFVASANCILYQGESRYSLILTMEHITLVLNL